MSPLQGFGNLESMILEAEEKSFSGICLLKTKTDRFKQFWSVLAGNEIFFYRLKENIKKDSPLSKLDI